MPRVRDDLHAKEALVDGRRHMVFRDRQLDGLVVLRTNLDWPLEEVVALYQCSTRLTQLLAGLPPMPPAGPVFWKSAAYQQGTIGCTSLALLLGHELDRRLRARGLSLS
jgi:hypothetical protein